MRKIYYQYDPNRRVYRRVYPTLGQKIISWAWRLALTVILGGVFFVIYWFVISTPQMGDLMVENSRLQSQYSVLSRRVDDALLVLHDIEERDDNLYRVLLEADPVSDVVRNAGYKGTNRYAELTDMANADLVISTAQKVDVLANKLYMQSRSFDEVVELSREQENKLACIPAIQPVSNKDLKRTASGYGYREDPIYRVRRFHHGMDFACDNGTPVYATGNGKVVYAKWKTGFGNLVEIDHGYGYKTRYAHLSKILVKEGQNVVRSEEIALSGSTGKSTGPHVHYEVWVGNKDVNPINYYFMDLDVDQYEEMISLAENHGKVFD